MNKVWLSGNLGDDPKVRETNSGKKVANFRLATKEYGGDTEWHNIVVWDKGAELAGKFLKKGRTVNLIGRIQHTKNEKDGKTYYGDQVVVDPGGLEFVGKAEPAKEAPADDDDLPI